MDSSTSRSDTGSSVDLSRQFLVAMPGKVGGSLASTVIYICEHTEQGALGLVINRPTDLTPGNLLERIELDLSLEIVPIQYDTVFFGGPVQTDRGFVLHRSEEHTSELQSLMRISYAVFCLKNKNKTH